MPGRQLFDALEQVYGRRREAVLQIELQIFDIERAPDLGVRKQGLYLGPVDEFLGVLVVIKRFDAEPVAGQQQAVLARIPDGQPEHAVDVIDEGRVMGEIEVQHHLGVTVGGEAVTGGAQLLATLLEIECLTIEDDGLLPRGRKYRLVAAAQIDDRQAAHTDAGVAEAGMTLIIRATMHDLVVHRPQGLRADTARAVEVVDADYSAHAVNVRSIESVLSATAAHVIPLAVANAAAFIPDAEHGGDIDQIEIVKEVGELVRLGGDRKIAPRL